MENKNYRRRVAVARFGYAFRDYELCKALFDSRHHFIPYRYDSLIKALDECDTTDLSKFPLYSPDLLLDGHLLPCLCYYITYQLRISSIVFFSNGDIDIYFKSFHYKN